MDELTIQTLIKAKYSGNISEMSLYVNIAIQAVAVLVGGFALWRISIAIQKRKMAQRKRSPFFESPYSEGWKRKK